MKDSKICIHCGRVMTYRKKWEKNWESVKYCSDRCRSEAKSSRTLKADHSVAKDLVPNEYEKKILELLRHRGNDKTICPSEILAEEEKQNHQLMEAVRQAARRLVAKNKIEILQKGQVVDPSQFRGPIRLRLKNGI